jgi:hypothetical protein
MSDRRPANVLLSEIKSACRRATRHKGLSKSDDIAKSVYDDVKYLRSEETDERVWRFYIKQMARLNAGTRRARADDDDYQLHFHYWDDLDTLLPIKRQAFDTDLNRTVSFTDLVELGNFDVREMDARSGQVKDNVKTAILADDTWERAVNVIKPLVQSHPGWKWKDAVEYLRGRDELPALPRT